MPAGDATTPPASTEWAAAVELAPMVNTWRQLLDDHVPDPFGRCGACTQGGTGIPAVRWPCGPRKIAELASRYYSDHQNGR